MGAFETLARTCLPCTCSHPDATVVCKPRSAGRITSSPGYDPAACKGRSLAFSRLPDPPHCGLWSSCIHTREGKDEQGSGSAWGELVHPCSKKKVHHLACSPFWCETSPYIHLSPWETSGWQNCSWKHAFRVHDLLAVRWEGHSILKWEWPCSPFPSRSSRVQLLDDWSNAGRNFSCRNALHQELHFWFCAEIITPWHLQ